jgi:Raf kinase inhibitor-like YbhB/YbcL family protein
MNRSIVLAAILFGVSAAPACAMTLSSNDIADGKTIPSAQIYPRCGGENISPALAWSGAPKGTKSFALTMIDLDVKPSFWSHWVVVDLPADVTSLARGTKTLPGGAHAIASNFGDAAYDGPCPPPGSGTHHYRLTIWALPVETLTLEPDEKGTDIIATLDKMALDRGSITGLVAR